MAPIGTNIISLVSMVAEYESSTPRIKNIDKYIAIAQIAAPLIVVR